MPPTSAVRVRYRPTAEDHLALYRRQLSSPGYRFARIGVTAIAGVLIAVLMIPGGLPAVAGVVLVAAAVVGLWVVGPMLAGRRIASRFAGAEAPPEVEYLLDATGIHGSAARAEWSDVIRVDETAHAFVVSIRPGAGAYLPKRAIADADLAPLRTLFESHVGARARLRRD
jgi:hypothetical protein